MILWVVTLCSVAGEVTVNVSKRIRCSVFGCFKPKSRRFNSR